LGGAASPPGEARGAVPEVVHEFASLTAPLGPAFAGPVPPNGLRPRGDKQVPQGFLPPGAKRHWREQPRRQARRGGPSQTLVHEFAPLTAPLGPAFAGPVPPNGLRPRGDKQVPRGFLPPGAKRHWGEQPRRQARRGGPSQTLVHEFASLTAPLGPALPGRSPQTASGRGGTDTWKTPRVSPPRSGATLGGAASPPGEARGAVREGKISS
jgi:hypothetical protein